ncbi:reverse transcriptase [Phytophthora megakarya]|uniref:Reverse transcriptase n=1 Tax=Phytophthora megakarya TaxID=4795 RepID=A0A225US48_9STRA|nr:reverse transcriptase [Phytophthora megakarya]
MVGEFEDSSPRGRINPNVPPLRSDQQQEDAMLRLVVPSTMIQEVLQNCHDSLEGGHQGIARTFYRVKLDYYWIGLYANVARHVRSCPDCSSSNSRPTIRGYSPGNILAERPFQVVSMDFVIPLPKSAGKHCAPAIPMRIHGVCDGQSYDRYDSSESSPSIWRMSRATLSYRPQCDGQQERSVKTVMQSVRVYAEDPLQQD